MKNLTDYINEGNISNLERKYRDFCQMCKGYNVNLEDVEVEKTSKNNWAVYVDGKKRFVAIKDCEVSYRQLPNRRTEFHDFVQLNINSIIILRPTAKEE